MALKPFAIIDIGSNSVRLVVYSGPKRVPTPIFNERVMAGLGVVLGETGNLSKQGMDRALAALRRFKILSDYMKVDNVRTVATAAVRDAKNGASFVRQVERLGLNCEVVSAQEEARLAGEGVLAGIPDADGIAGDLGGGSLELVHVSSGHTGTARSLPLGVLRVDASSSGRAAARDSIRIAMRGSELAAAAHGKNLYLIGGSWRALAKIHMLSTGYPLQVVHQYRMPAAAAADLSKLTNSPDPSWAKSISKVRLASSPVAAMLLQVLVQELEPHDLVLSSYGIREGLHFSRLKRRDRALDPLLEAVRDASEAERRFGAHGDLLDDWIGAVFDDSPSMQRLRIAACLLADVAWQASAAFRAERAVEMALHGNWAGIDAPGRVIVAQALSSSFGRDKLPEPALSHLCRASELDRARQWGLAIRLGQRLSAGVGAVLASSSLTISGSRLYLKTRKDADLIGEAVQRHLTHLAGSMELRPGVSAI